MWPWRVVGRRNGSVRVLPEENIQGCVGTEEEEGGGLYFHGLARRTSPVDKIRPWTRRGVGRAHSPPLSVGSHLRKDRRSMKSTAAITRGKAQRFSVSGQHAAAPDEGPSASGRTGRKRLSPSGQETAVVARMGRGPDAGEGWRFSRSGQDASHN